jgi:hypothetical protein
VLIRDVLNFNKSAFNVCNSMGAVAARSKAKVCCRLVAGVAVSNPARGKDVCLLCLCVLLSCVGRGLCDGLITRPEESYRVSNCMHAIKKPRKGRPKVHPGL